MLIWKTEVKKHNMIMMTCFYLACVKQQHLLVLNMMIMLSGTLALSDAKSNISLHYTISQTT